MPPPSPRTWPWFAYYAAVGTWRRRGPRLHESVVVNGAPRSGTTWLGAAVADLTGWPMLHEPTHPPRIPEHVARVGWDGRPWRDPDEPDDQLVAVLEPLLVGTYLGAGLLARTRRNELGLWRRRPVVSKHITLNLLLPWLLTSMPWLRVVQVVRHPFAVVASQEGRAGSYWATSTSLSQPYRRLMEARPEYAAETEHATPAEALVTAWAIEHAWLRDTAARTERALWLRYEEVRADPDALADRLAAHLGLDPPDAAARARLRQPSRTVEPSATTFGAASPHAAWRERYDDAQRERLRAILARFDFPFYDESTLG